MRDLADVEFSERQDQVLRLVCWGYTNNEIGDLLHLAPNTIKVHMRRLMRKFGADNRTQLVSFAFRRGKVNWQCPTCSRQ